MKKVSSSEQQGRITDIDGLWLWERAGSREEFKPGEISHERFADRLSDNALAG